MRRELSGPEIAFEREVQAFLDAHWGPAGTAGGADEGSWRRALVERGWSVPTWPAVAGGPGWSATQVFIWRRACAARGVVLEDDAAIDIVGPLVLRYADAAQQTRYLPEIRNYECRWCIGVAEPESGDDWSAMSTVAAPSGAGFELNGTKTWVRDGLHARRMCCLAGVGSAGSQGLFAVDMAAPGVTITSIATLDGDAGMAQVTLDAVRVPADALFAGPFEAGELARLLFASESSTLSRSAVAAAQLDVLDAVIETFDPSDSIHQRRQAVAVELEGLKALELRFLDARQRRQPLPFSLELLRLKSREILLQLGALQVESFGYYALPYPDETLLHNEGPIGPENAAATIRRTLTQQVAALYEGSAERLKDATWRGINTEG
jgi:alkylation response protein AidB-like acyl-CoA dehydrogenase